MKMYDSKNCLVNLSNSILKRFGCPTFHDSIKDVDELLKNKKKIVLFLFDAMGKNVLEANPKQTKFLRANVFKQITSTFPPTTVAATNALLSGKFPTENGWFSWSQYFKDYDRNINVFPNNDSQTFEPVPNFNYHEIAKYDHLAELINKQNQKTMAWVQMEYPIDPNGHKSYRQMMKMAEEKIRSVDEGFVYAYCTQPDHDCHKYGITSLHVKSHLCRINHYVKKFAERNKDVLVLVIADHGHINVEPTILNEHPDFLDTLKRPFSFESRSANFFVKEGREEEFKTLFKKYFSKDFELYTKQEVIDKEFYGPKDMPEKYLSFFGDFIAISVTNHYFAVSKEMAFFKGHHAGGTQEEMMLNLMALNTKE